MFGNKKQLVINAIQESIAKEKIFEKVLFEDLTKKIISGEVTDSGTYYLLDYTAEEHGSTIVNNISSRDMFQALKSITETAEYDVTQDYTHGSIGNYEIYIYRYNDGSGKYIVIGARGTYNYITEKMDELISGVQTIDKLSPVEELIRSLEADKKIDITIDIDDDEIP